MESITARLERLRVQMTQHGLSAWLQPSADPHATEYLPLHWQGRRWLSGFTGSVGTLVVLEDRAGLWVDGRYHLQAETELAGSGITQFKDGLPDTPAYTDWLASELSHSATLGVDGRLISQQQKEKLTAALEQEQINIQTDLDLLSAVWRDRPALPKTAIFEHPVSYAGLTRQEKIQQVREALTQQKATHGLITTLDDIAWLYNIRGSDIAHCPFATSFALVSHKQAWLFIDPDKVPLDLQAALHEDGVELDSYDKINHALQQLPPGSRLQYDPVKANSALLDQVSPACEQKPGKSIVGALKAKKNPTEIAHFKQCHIKDGIAMVRFLKWLDENVPQGGVTEMSAAQRLREYRQEIDTFVDLSFTTIPGYGPNGAKMHYAVTEESNLAISDNSFFLVDSGGQYLDGTTDVTRTMFFGEPNQAQNRDYTLVVKGHIQLSLARFMRGTCGVQLDILARQPLWRQGINYGCGTGHGVGFFLNVHEGPHSISTKPIDEPLVPGMVVTNEPGIYRPGEHGVRIENIMLVSEAEKTEFGEFYAFEQLTLCPIALKPLLVGMLSDEEKHYLNRYHQLVVEKLSPLLSQDEQDWLQANTRPV